MANFKNITDLPVAESAEGLNLIVNDSGSAKQIAASAVGAQADWAEMDETSPAFIKNKPVEEWDLDLFIEVPFNSDTGENDTPIFTANDGYSYTAFINKIEAGEFPKMRCKTKFYSNVDNVVNFINTPMWIEKEGDDCYIAIVIFNNVNCARLNSDNTIVFD